ncbi:MAG: hypothetical protein ABI080_11860 [Candidatus Binatia bacterium]
MRTTPANLRDWQIAYGDRTSTPDYAAVTVPTLVLRGEFAHPAVRCSNERCQRAPECGPHLRRRRRALMIATHPANVAALVEAHAIAAADAVRRYRW